MSNWRNGLVSSTYYFRKFALIPKRLQCGSVVWFDHYYAKHIRWANVQSVASGSTIHGVHTDIEYISEQQYLVERLSDDS